MKIRHIIYSVLFLCGVVIGASFIYLHQNDIVRSQGLPRTVQTLVTPRRTVIIAPGGEPLTEITDQNASSSNGVMTILPSILDENVSFLYNSVTSLAVKFKNYSGKLYYQNVGESWKEVGSATGGGSAYALVGDGTHDIASNAFYNLSSLYNTSEISLFVVTKLTTLSAVSNFYEERLSDYDCIQQQFLINASGYLEYVRSYSTSNCETYTITHSETIAANLTTHPIAVGVAYRNHSAMFFVDGIWSAIQGFGTVTTTYPTYTGFPGDVTVTLGAGFPSGARIYVFMRGQSIPFAESSFMTVPREGASQWPGFLQGYFLNEQQGDDIHDTQGLYDLIRGDNGIVWYYDDYGY